jgi:uncharacterized protein YegJ (DUF2314 family)
MRTVIPLVCLSLCGPPALAQLARNAPADQPVALTTAQIAVMEKAVAPYVKTARETYPAARAKFLAGLPTGQTFYVVTRLTDPGGHAEQAFIRVQAIEGSSITGIIASHLQLISNRNAGQSYTFDESDLVDWVITKPDGSEEGNVVGKFLDTYKP